MSTPCSVSTCQMQAHSIEYQTEPHGQAPTEFTKVLLKVLFLAAGAALWKVASSSTEVLCCPSPSPFSPIETSDCRRTSESNQVTAPIGCSKSKSALEKGSSLMSLMQKHGFVNLHQGVRTT